MSADCTMYIADIQSDSSQKGEHSFHLERRKNGDVSRHLQRIIQFTLYDVTSYTES